MELKIESYTKPYINKTDHHLYIAPSPKLQNIVAHYTITFQNHELEIPEHSVLNLIPDVSGCFVFKFFDKLSIKVWGPTTKVVTVDNDLNTFPCRFFIECLPGGLYQVLGINVHSILDQKIELEDLNEALYQEIRDLFEKVTTFDEVVEIIDDILCREVKKHSIHQQIIKSIERIYTQHESFHTSLIAAELGISERQLNRYFHKYVGMSFKKFTKIVNINHLIQDMSKKKLIDLTFDYEYFDQAHFNHVFKEICQTTPTHYLQNLSDFYNELYKF